MVTIAKNSGLNEALRAANHNRSLTVFGARIARAMKDTPNCIVDVYLDRVYHGQRRTVVQMEIAFRQEHLFITFAPAFRGMKAEVKIRDMISRQYVYSGDCPKLGAVSIIDWLDSHEYPMDTSILEELFDRLDRK